MAKERVKRKLSAILCADVVGYSRLMGEDEAATLNALNTCDAEIIEPTVKEHNGRIFKRLGDGFLVEFSSAVDSVECALAWQKQIENKNHPLQFRIGINLGDVIEQDEDMYGDGVNIAARIEKLADPGGICISRNIYDHIKKKVNLGYEFLGEKQVKNISEPVGVYKLLTKSEDAGKLIGEKSPIIFKRPWFALGGLALIVLIAGAITLWNNFKLPDIEAADLEKMAFELPEKPSIAVLPFTNLSGDPEHELVSDALTSDIISTLSYQSELFVIDRHSSFFYKDKPVKIATVAEELGVQHVLEGSIQISSDKIRVTAQLIDAINGEHLWTERYDKSFTDIFKLVDDITFNIISETQSEILGESPGDPREGGTENLEAWLLYLQAQKHRRNQTKEGFHKAMELLEQALEKDPDFVNARTGRGWVIWHTGLKGYSETPDEALKEAEEIAQQLVKNYPNNVNVNGLMIAVHMTNREFSEALALAEKNVEIEPNSAKTNADLAWVLLSNMQPDKAINQFEKAMRLDPYYPPWFLNVMIRSYVLAGRYDEAKLAIQQQLQRSPGNFFNGQAHLNLAVVYSNLGEPEKAKAEIAKAIEIWPKNTISFVRREVDCTDQTFVADYFQTLQQLGLPE